MQPATPSDEELVDHLAEVWRSLRELGETLSEDEWKTPTAVPGWSVQDNLAHVVDIEARLVGRPAPEHELPEDLPHVKNDFGRTNEVFVDARRSWTGAAVLDEFVEVTDARLAQLRAPGCDLGDESWTPVGPGTVRDLLPFRAFDAWVHEQDMRDAVGRPGDDDTAVAAAALDRIAGSMPYVVGKKAGAPDGATVVFALSGPHARDLAIGVEGGRARPLAEVPADPTVRIVTDTGTFARLATGRFDPHVAFDGGRAHVEGDGALGRRIVEELDFLF